MDINLLLTILFGVIGAIGVGTSIYFGKKSANLEKSKVSLDFEDLFAATSDIADYIKGVHFHPDIVYTPGGKSGILAELLSQKFTHEPLVVVGSLEWKETGTNQFQTGNSAILESNKWKIIIPDIIGANTDKKILVVDDICMSGDALQSMITKLCSLGYSRDNIKTSSLVCTSVAKASQKAPDYSWKETEGTTYFFPWGKTR